MVEDLKGSVRRILDFCGLPFEPACLEFHKTERSVRTAVRSRCGSPSAAKASTSGGTMNPGWTRSRRASATP